MRGNDRLFGWWFVAAVGGVERSESLLPMNAKRDVNGIELFFGTSWGAIRVILTQNADGGFNVNGTNQTLPANSQITIYEAVI